MTARPKFIDWLQRERSSARLGFILQTAARILSSLLTLVWTRWLLGAMGPALNGLFLNFQSLTALGGLGELGLGGAVSFETGRQLGRDREQELREFLAAARTVFLFLALAFGLGFFTLSPWLARGLDFSQVPAAGPLPGLFLLGAGSVGLVMLGSYINNLNYACGNVTWPVVPAFVLTQISLAAHWWLARQQAPLWAQYAPYAAATLLGLGLSWFYVRISHPRLATLWPLRLDRRTVMGLLEKGLWIYLCGLGNLIFTTTDRLLVGKGFGLEEVPRYHYNYKLCELAWFVISAASYVSLPKIAQWIASPAATDRTRVVQETHRLNRFQTLLGCAAALVYLAVNDLFMQLWLGEAMRAPALLQLAFAANLAVTTCGDSGVQLCMRCGDQGLRRGGLAIGLTGLLNLGLSWLAMSNGWMAGIALATVVAQSVLSLVAGRFTCRHLGIPWGRWVWNGWMLPVLAVGAAAGLRWLWPPDSGVHAAALAGVYAVILFGVSQAVGFRPAMIREEWRQLRAIFQR